LLVVRSELSRKMRALDGRRARWRGEHDLNLRQDAADFRDLDPGTEFDAVTHQGVEHNGGAFGVVAGQRRRRVEHGDLGAEPAERPRQF
jgi:hypothetical protein